MKSHKVHMYAQFFSLSFPAWEDILKFDTTAKEALMWTANPRWMHGTKHSLISRPSAAQVFDACSVQEGLVCFTTWSMVQLHDSWILGTFVSRAADKLEKQDKFQPRDKSDLYSITKS